MMRDYYYFKRRYEQIEDEFLELYDFIEMDKDLSHHCYKFGSSKLMDFCLKVCTEIETIFRVILDSPRFDGVPDINNKRKHQNINVYRELIGQVYNLTDYKLNVRHIDLDFYPFDKFDIQTPNWFRFYSKHKHNKLELIKRWNLKFALYALGCLRLLILNHPGLDGSSVDIRDITYGKVFYLKNSLPRFVRVTMVLDSGTEFTTIL